MTTIKIPLKEAQKVKTFIVKNNLIDRARKGEKDEEFLYIAVLDAKPILNKFPKAKRSMKQLEKIKREPTTLREALKGKLTEEEMDNLKTAFDTVGEIAILEIEDILKPKEKLIADTLLKMNRKITTVLKKESIHEGVFRTQKMKHLAGKKTKEAVHRENNVTLKLDVEKVYFSPRLSTERKRIMRYVKKGEDVLVMFSGCAPYVCAIAKNTDAKKVTGIEINPAGHRYAEENIRKNKIKNAELYCGDVRKVVPKLKKKYDRILMPLPKSAEDFLDTALVASKKGTVIHFYAFLHEKEFSKAKEEVKDICKKNKKECRILRTIRCGQHAPRTYRICVDLSIK